MQIQWNKIIEEINSTSERYLLCVSGGVDSMFMLEFFNKNCRQPFRVAHFNHDLRPSADEEEAFVGRWCEKNGISFVTTKGDPEAMRAASSLEAEARNQRYAFFQSVKRDDELVVTAHHANDQIETVLMRLIRGVPHDQLRMGKRVADRYRPFLAVPREEIERQARNRRIEWIEDESNADIVHERNWMRHVIIPQLMERRNVLKTIGLNAAEHEMPSADDDSITP
ncbi:tRNA lysidine(34) synthetase TilS [Agrobacterium rubi]|nr:tRNA lysidine(34) synthetase TilS [Agrobacterium rubi]NTF23835.1 tRNA lysidine(34) synthetase TilS [Agrobacterium rubi]